MLRELCRFESPSHLAGRTRASDDCDAMALYLRGGLAKEEERQCEKGRILTKRTSGGTKSYRMSNLLQCCLRAAVKADAELPTMSIKFLRKTSQDYMRPMVGDELTSVHARRGRVSADTLMKFYTSPPWRNVAQATDRLVRERFADAFGLAVMAAG